MTTSRGLRFLATGAAVFALAACAWVAGGKAYAAKREREAVQTLEKTLGARAALEARYAVAETNAEAREAEKLARAVGSDLSPSTRPSRDKSDFLSGRDRAAIGDYVTAQLVRPDDAPAPPSSELAALLERLRLPLTAFEEFLVSSPSPKWVFDPRSNRDARLEPNGLGHMRVQRLLVADALAAAARGDSAGAVRALEASWKLNEGLAHRPEVVARIIATAVQRLEAGCLRKIPAPAPRWTPRLAAMGDRAALVDALVLDRDARDPAAFYAHQRPAGVGWWAHNVRSLLEEPAARRADSDGLEAWALAVAGLRDAPFFGAPAAAPPGAAPASVILSIEMPSIRNSFERADRLALDAELTTKILELAEARRARGAWPDPSPGIAASRFPGLSWAYAPKDGGMTIALSRELPEAKMPFVLPTTFSSRATRP